MLTTNTLSKALPLNRFIRDSDSPLKREELEDIIDSQFEAILSQTDLFHTDKLNGADYFDDDSRSIQWDFHIGTYWWSVYELKGELSLMAHTVYSGHDSGGVYISLEFHLMYGGEFVLSDMPNVFDLTSMDKDALFKLFQRSSSEASKGQSAALVAKSPTLIWASSMRDNLKLNFRFDKDGKWDVADKSMRDLANELDMWIRGARGDITYVVETTNVNFGEALKDMGLENK